MPGSSKCSLSLRFPHQNLVYNFPIHASCPAHIILFDLITWIMCGEQYRLLISSLYSFLHTPVTSSSLDSNILLNTLFSNTLSLRSWVSVSDQVPHPYTTTSEIIVLYILLFTFLDSKLEDKRFCTEWWEAFPEFNPLLISSWIDCDSLRLFPNFWNVPNFQGKYYQFLCCYFILQSDLETWSCT